jgi:hypothetical protein
MIIRFGQVNCECAAGATLLSTVSALVQTYDMFNDSESSPVPPSFRFCFYPRHRIARKSGQMFVFDTVTVVFYGISSAFSDSLAITLIALLASLY